MSDADDKARIETVTLAARIMSLFGHDMPAFFASLHPDVSVELPQGEAVGLPAVARREEAHALFRLAAEGLDVKFTDVRIHPTVDPNKIVVEYKGLGHPKGRLYQQNYVSFQEYRDGKLFKFREYFDTDIAKNVAGDILKDFS
jgi:ketosteroid isomerase-like protein